MKKKFLCAGLCLLLSCLMLASCTPRMKYEDGGYYLSKTDTVYYPAPAQYQAKAYLPDKVGRIDQKKIDDVVLYAIEGMDGSKWLCSEDYQVFYASGEKLPALWEMEIQRVLINRTVDISYTMKTIMNKETITGLVNVYRSGIACTNSQVDPGNSFDGYDLVFEGESLRYCLTYRQYSSDVLINIVIDNPTNYPVYYPGIPVSVETDTDPVTGEKTHYAVYNFGKHIIYDRLTQKVYSAGAWLDGYMGAEDEA